jgi:hypothetical protein
MTGEPPVHIYALLWQIYALLGLQRPPASIQGQAKERHLSQFEPNFALR